MSNYFLSPDPSSRKQKQVPVMGNKRGPGQPLWVLSITALHLSSLVFFAASFLSRSSKHLLKVHLGKLRPHPAWYPLLQKIKETLPIFLKIFRHQLRLGRDLCPGLALTWPTLKREGPWSKSLASLSGRRTKRLPLPPVL
jgi:hypothetical protein